LTLVVPVFCTTPSQALVVPEPTSDMLMSVAGLGVDTWIPPPITDLPAAQYDSGTTRPPPLPAVWVTLTIEYPAGFVAQMAETVNGSSIELLFSWSAVNLCWPF